MDATNFDYFLGALSLKGATAEPASLILLGFGITVWVVRRLTVRRSQR